MHLLGWALLPAARACGRWLGLPKVAELETPPRGSGTPGGHHHILAGRLPRFPFPSALLGLSNVLWISAVSRFQYESHEVEKIHHPHPHTHTINLSKGLCADQLRCKWLLQFGSQ